MPTRSQTLRKDQLLSAWVEGRQNILSDVSRLSEREQAQGFLGIWSSKDFGIRLRGAKMTIQRLLEAEMDDEQTHYKQIIGFFKGSK